MQFHYYETDYHISYKFEIIVMLIMYVKQHNKKEFSPVLHILECVIENYIISRERSCQSIWSH